MVKAKIKKTSFNLLNETEKIDDLSSLLNYWRLLVRREKFESFKEQINNIIESSTIKFDFNYFHLCMKFVYNTDRCGRLNLKKELKHIDKALINIGYPIDINDLFKYDHATPYIYIEPYQRTIKEAAILLQKARSELTAFIPPPRGSIKDLIYYEAIFIEFILKISNLKKFSNRPEGIKIACATCAEILDLLEIRKQAKIKATSTGEGLYKRTSKYIMKNPHIFYYATPLLYQILTGRKHAKEDYLA